MLILQAFIQSPGETFLNLGFITIRWYGLLISVSVLIGIFVSKKLAKARNINPEYISEILPSLIISSIIGARAYYVFFEWRQYSGENFFTSFELFNNIFQIPSFLAVWEGGIAIHGGLIGVIFASIFFAKKNNQNPFLYLDIVALVAPVGLFFGRVANFINSELYGTITNVPWAVTFVQVDNLPRHPSQLYEALLEGLFLFLLLIYFKNKFSDKPGVISGLFLIIYSIFRFIVEFFRVPDEQLGYIFLNLTMGQVVSLIFILSGVILFYLKYETR